MNKVFLDTNIVADIIDMSRKTHKQSLSLLKYLVLNKYVVCISEDMLTTIFYILKDKEHTLKFFRDLIFVDWKIYTFGMSIVEEATDLALQKNLDLEDTLQCLCAKENECKYLITNDKKFYDCGLEICTAEEFLSQKQLKKSSK